MPEYRKNELLIEARKRAGLTITEVAKRIGISFPAYSGYENGRLYPGKKSQKKICSFYGSMGIFLFEDDVFPEEIRDLSKKKYIPKKEPQSRPEITYLPLSDIRYISDHNPDIPAEYEMDLDMMRKYLAEGVRNILSTLSSREERVLRMRFGLGEYGREHTLEEIGNSFGLSEERIRQIEALALKRLRHSKNAKSLKALLEGEE